MDVLDKDVAYMEGVRMAVCYREYDPGLIRI